MRLSQIQTQIGRGEYRVNTEAVADAIIRRLGAEQRPSPQGVPASERVLVATPLRRHSVDPELGRSGPNLTDHGRGPRLDARG